MLFRSGSIPAFANSPSWWDDSIDQNRRNQEIVNASYRDLGKYLGSDAGQCKVWIQSVVRYASLNHVSLPQNAGSPNDWYWQSDPYGHAVYMNMPLEYANVGWIVQMRLRGGTSHTFIIIGKTSSGVNVIDSNFVAQFTVGTHFITYTQFYGMLESPGHYSIVFREVIALFDAHAMIGGEAIHRLFLWEKTKTHFIDF